MRRILLDIFIASPTDAMNCKPYSLENPPNAPRRPTAPARLLERRLARLSTLPRLTLPPLVEPREMEAADLAATGCIRQRFLTWTPDDIEEIDDAESLFDLMKLFNPFSQPQNNFEEAYLSLLRDCCRKRIYALRRSSSPIH